MFWSLGPGMISGIGEVGAPPRLNGDGAGDAGASGAPMEFIFDERVRGASRSVSCSSLYP